MLIKMSQSPKDRYCMMRYREVKFTEQRLVEWWLTEAGREGGVTVINEYRVSYRKMKRFGVLIIVMITAGRSGSRL